LIYELRIYRPHQGKLEALLERFRNHSLRLLAKHGMVTVGFWTHVSAENGDEVIYVLQFEDEAHQKKGWIEFFADPEWQRVHADSEIHGPLVEKVTSRLMQKADFFANDPRPQQVQI